MLETRRWLAPGDLLILTQPSGADHITDICLAVNEAERGGFYLLDDEGKVFWVSADLLDLFYKKGMLEVLNESR